MLINWASYLYRRANVKLADIFTIFIWVLNIFLIFIGWNVLPIGNKIVEACMMTISFGLIFIRWYKSWNNFLNFDF